MKHKPSLTLLLNNLQTVAEEEWMSQMMCWGHQSPDTASTPCNNKTRFAATGGASSVGRATPAF